MTSEDKKTFYDRRNQLQSRIDDFHQKIQNLFSNSDWGTINFPCPSTEDEAGSDEWLDDDECPEKSRLLMPSALGKDECKKIGWEKMMKQELELRIGQAEHALEKLRLTLGHKTVVYVVEARKAKSQATKTRSRSAVKQADKIIDKHWNIYQLAYQAILKLDASKNILQKFRPLKKEDLRVNTDVTEENRIGQRSDVLAWFWKQGDGNSDNKWMNEGK
jgi:ribosomal protein L31E